MVVMCRLLALISPKPSNVYHWVYEAEWPLVHIARPGYRKESHKGHKDGWGIAWFIRKGYMLVKEPVAIYESRVAKDVVANAYSDIVLFHIRHATKGLGKVYVNTHPFTYGPYVFIHNGELKRDPIISMVPEEFKSHIYGTTDSEAYFIYLISRISEKGDILEALTDSLPRLIEIGDGLTISDIGPSLNFVLSEGDKVYAFKWRLKDDETHYSLYYRRLGDDGFLVSSEPLDSSKDWVSFDNGELIVVDKELNEEHIIIKT